MRIGSKPLAILGFAFSAATLVHPGPAQAQSSPSPYTNAARYDAMGRVTGTIAPDPDGAGPLAYAAVRNTYNAAGQLVRVEQGELATWQSEAVAPASWPGFTVFRRIDTVYDAMGRKVRETVTGSDGVSASLTQYGYDAFGNLECTAVRMDPADFAGTLPDACTPTAPAGPHGNDRITRLLYDEAGQLIQDRRAVATPREQAEATYTYNGNGQRTTVIDANGNRAALTYDGHGRLRCWIFPSTSQPSSFNPATPATALASAGALSTTDCETGGGDFERYGYDPNGNRTSLRKRDGALFAFDYDALNRLTRKVVPERAGLAAAHTRDVHYGYDLRGLQTFARFDSSSGEGVTNAYDGFGRLVSSTIDMGGAGRTLDYQYDPNGNRVRLTHPDGHWFSMNRYYDGRLAKISENSLTSADGSTWLAHFWYDRLGGREQVMWGSNGSPLAYTYAMYGYDPVGRLQSLDHFFPLQPTMNVATDFAFNPAGQVASQTRTNDAFAWTAHYNVSRAYQANGLNQYMSAGSATFAYDANGNLVSDGTSAYVYDAENRLVSGPGGVTLTYDPLGRLFQVAGGSSGTTRFLYDGDALVAEYDGSGNVLRRYVHGAGADEPLVWYEGAAVGWANRRWLQANHQGSIVSVANVNGHVLAVNSYDPWGIPGPNGMGRFRYTGQIWIPELGLYHYKARAYSPTLGRFLQTDPVGYDDQVNLYAYVGNDPVNATDPDGSQTRYRGIPIPFPSLAAPPAAARPPTPERIQQDIRDAGRFGIRVITTGIGCVFGSCQAGQAAGDYINQALLNEGQEEGCIYCVPGEATPSGDDYIGRSDDWEARQRDRRDGRDRRRGHIVRTYPRGDTQAGQNAEQEEINARGGPGNLDNRRNEVAPRRWRERGIRPPPDRPPPDDEGNDAN